jgi:hypothetical protein
VGGRALDQASLQRIIRPGTHQNFTAKDAKGAKENFIQGALLEKYTAPFDKGCF